MIKALLLDTHIVLWLDTGSDRPSPCMRELIDACWRKGGTLFVSAATAWEVALLADCGRIMLDVPVRRWIDRLIGQPGLDLVPIDADVATAAYTLPAWTQRDPGDRLLIATAIKLRVPPVTYDTRIAAFAREHGTGCGLEVSV